MILMVSAMFTYIASHLGWRVDCVLSGSMEPELSTGSLAITRPVESESVEVGDVITFHDNSQSNILITHRVTRIWDNDPVYYQTKGDACQKDDPFIVTSKNLVGKVCYDLPFAGYFIYFLKTPVGFFVSIVLPTSILLVIYIRSIWKEIRKYRGKRAGEVANR
jgi:signal peptidase